MLLVDDDESLALTTSALLEDEFDVTTVSSGAAALAHLARAAVDVLCTDLQMPGMDGIELVRRVAEQHPHVTSIVVTGHREYLSDLRTKEVSFSVLLKPYALEELTDSVRRAAQLGRLKRSFTRPPASAGRRA